MEGQNEKALGLVLPEGILDFFTITHVDQLKDALHFHFEEKNIIPQEYTGEPLESKGFYEEIKVQDFPIRGKAVYLMIKRRRWLNLKTGNIVFRDWTLVAKGTRMTTEFASFLKAISGYESRKL